MMYFSSPVLPKTKVVWMMIAVWMAMLLGEKTLVTGQWVGCFVEPNTGEDFVICVWGYNRSPLQLSYDGDIFALGTDSYIFSVCRTFEFSVSSCDCAIWVNPFLPPVSVPGEGYFGLSYILGYLYDPDEACHSCELGAITSNSFSLNAYDCSNRLPLTEECAVFSSDIGCTTIDDFAPNSALLTSPNASPISTLLAQPSTTAPVRTPIVNPTDPPTKAPIPEPTDFPKNPPTNVPVRAPNPTDSPTDFPTNSPTLHPTNLPTKEPIADPTKIPTNAPVTDPTRTNVAVSASKEIGNPTTAPKEDATAVEKSGSNLASRSVAGLVLATMAMTHILF